MNKDKILNAIQGKSTEQITDMIDDYLKEFSEVANNDKK